MMDEKTQKLVWQGQVPVIFTLADREVTSMEPPMPLCMLLPRMGFLPLRTTEVRAHFLPSAPAVEDEMWFDYQDVPLRWNIPIGALADILMQSSKAELPLPITVHFQAFPTQKILRCKNTHTVRSHFLNAFKEALFLKYGSSKLVQGISQADTSSLWEAIAANKYDDFSVVRNKMMKKGETEAKTVQSLPVRMYVSGFGSGESRFECKCIQQPIKPEIDGKKQTLESLFKSVLPGIVYDTESGELSSEVEVLIHGINPPMDTPLAWLCENMCHPDQFLYISVICHAS